MSVGYPDTMNRKEASPLKDKGHGKDNESHIHKSKDDDDAAANKIKHNLTADPGADELVRIQDDFFRVPIVDAGEALRPTPKGVERIETYPYPKASTKITKVKPKTNTQKLKERTELLNKIKTNQKGQKAFLEAKNEDAKKEKKAGRKLVRVNKKINRST